MQDTVAGMTRRTIGRDASARLHARAVQTLVEGVSSPMRGPASYDPHPLFVRRGTGGRLEDVDGNVFVDLMLGFGSLIHGHAHPRLVATLREALGDGMQFAAASEAEIEAAERIARIVPHVERVRFASTGTEATMSALRVARGFTGRPAFVKFEGHYHGWSDAFCVSSNLVPPAAMGHPNDPVRIPDSSGVSANAIADTVVVPWNDLDRLEAALRRHPGRVAAIFTEPVMANMGVIPPGPGYLEGVRALADEHDVLLVLDETCTGFRLAPGGAQERFGIRADLVTFGKALGAGVPISAVAGRADVMSTMTRGRVLHFGTHNANPALLAMANASLDLLAADDGAALRELDVLAQRLVDGWRAAFAAAGIEAVVQAVGSLLQVFFAHPGAGPMGAIEDARSCAALADPARFRRFQTALRDRGVWLSPSAGFHSVLCTQHTAADVDEVLAATADAIAAGAF